MQIQNNKITGYVGNSFPVRKVAVEDDDSFLGRISPRKSDNGFESFAPHAPMNVKMAWNKAAEQTGADGLGIGDNGMMTHIPAALIVQAEQNHQTGSSDVFGNSVESAKAAATKILDRLNNPVIQESNSKIRDLHDKEKAFYKAFVGNLNDLSGSAYDLWKSYN